MNRPHHFVGTLTGADAEPLQGIHQITVGLTDDDGTQHIAHLVYGRGDVAAQRCRAVFDALQVGQRYHGSATLQRVGDAHVQHFGNVVLAADRRRERALTLAMARHHSTAGATA